MSDNQTRREFLKTSGAAAAAASGMAKTLTAYAAGIAPAKRPNIVYVLADQLRAQSVGYAGDEKARTSQLDRLAAEGADFTQCISSTPVCAAYRNSLFTGKYASSTGMVVNELRCNPNHRCFGHVVTEAGYDTGYIGKWHLWGAEAGGHNKMKNSYIPPDMRKYRLGFDGFWAAYNFNHRYYQAFYYKDTPRRIAVEGFEPDVQTDMAVDYIKRHAGGKNPFSLTLSIGTPHDPWGKENCPPKYYEMFRDVSFPLPQSWTDTPDPYMDRNTDPKKWLDFWKPNLEMMQRGYYSMTANLDWNVGRLLNSLDEAGIAEDTIFVFSSDHGEMFGAQGRVFKLTFYEEAARVPMLLRWPGKIPRGTTCDACMDTPDIMPTLLGLMDLEVPKDVDGMDLSHLARGKEGPQPEAALLQGMGHTYLWRDGYEWRALRDKEYTFAVYRIDGKELLFNNKNDPKQLKNVIDDPAHAQAAARLRKQLAAKMKDLGDTFEACSWYRDHWTENRRILRGAKG